MPRCASHCRLSLQALHSVAVYSVTGQRCAASRKPEGNAASGGAFGDGRPLRFIGVMRFVLSTEGRSV